MKGHALQKGEVTGKQGEALAQDEMLPLAHSSEQF